MEKQLIILLLVCLFGSSCGNRSGQNRAEEDAQVDTPQEQETILMDETVLLHDILLSVTDGKDGKRTYYKLVKDRKDVLELFRRICGERECEIVSHQDSTTHTCEFPDGKSKLVLTCYGRRKGNMLARLSVCIEGISDVESVKFIVCKPKPKKAKEPVKIKEAEEEYSRGTLSEIDY